MIYFGWSEQNSNFEDVFLENCEHYLVQVNYIHTYVWLMIMAM